MVLYTPHVAQLRRLLQGPDPIVVLAEPDDAYLDRVLTQTLQREGVEVESIDATGTWTHVVGTRRERRGENTLEEFLEDTAREVERRGHTCVLWLRDVSEDLRRPTAMGRLKAIATRWRERGRHTHEPVFGSRILVSGHDATTPPHLEHLARVTALDRIHRGEEGRVFLEAVLRPTRPDADDELLTGLLESLQGLSPAHAHRVILRAAAAGHDLERHVRLERDRMLETGAIEVRSTSNRRIGGLDVLQAHLQDVAELWNDLRSAADPMQRDRLKQLLPKGMLLLGPPGCGKSLAAEVTASVLGVPLLQLHVSRLMDRFLGGTEERLESALAIARAAAPCVLWIDELEKALAGTGGEGDGGGTGRRMLGRLLTWMQENRHEIYVVATANALDHVPPELLRRGRFDDHFVLDYPEEYERSDILRLSLEEHGLESTLSEADLRTLAHRTQGFSGADLAALVQEASRRAWLIARRVPERAHFEQVLAEFKPQAKQFVGQSEESKRQLKKYEFRAASSPKGGTKPLRTTAQATAEALPDALRALCEVPSVVRWASSEWVLEIELRDGALIGWLGPGDATGVQHERATTYRSVVGLPDELTLRAAGVEEPLRIRASTAGIAVWWNRAWREATSGPRQRAKGPAPGLWRLLGTDVREEVVELPDLGRASLTFVWSGEQRIASLRVQRRQLCQYRVEVEGTLVVLEPTWVTPMDSHAERLRGLALVGDGVRWWWRRAANPVAVGSERLDPPRLPLDAKSPTISDEDLQRAQKDAHVLTLEFVSGSAEYKVELSPSSPRCRITFAGVRFVATIGWRSERKGLVATTSIPRPIVPSSLQPGELEISLELTRKAAEVVVLRNDERVRVARVKVHEVRR